MNLTPPSFWDNVPSSWLFFKPDLLDKFSSFERFYVTNSFALFRWSKQLVRYLFILIRRQLKYFFFSQKLGLVFGHRMMCSIRSEKSHFLWCFQRWMGLLFKLLVVFKNRFYRVPQISRCVRQDLLMHNKSRNKKETGERI